MNRVIFYTVDDICNKQNNHIGIYNDFNRGIGKYNIVTLLLHLTLIEGS